MTSIVINGNAYSDDGSTPQDMQHYGYLTHLLPMIGDTATVAGQVAIDAAQAALDAGTASNGALALRGTSTTSLAVSAGTKTLTTQAGKQFAAGNYVTISRTSAPTTRAAPPSPPPTGRRCATRWPHAKPAACAKHAAKPCSASATRRPTG